MGRDRCLRAALRLALRRDRALHVMRALGALAQCMVARAAERGGPLPLVDASMQGKIYERAAHGARRAAVLVPIASVEGVPSVVFSVRSGKVSTHRHQVAFPGGHVEDGESALDAAYRETLEELGNEFCEGFATVDLCTDVMAVTGTIVTPVVAVRQTELNLEAVVPSDEVASVFSLPVAHLLSHRNRQLRTYDHRGKLPVFLGGPAEIWGLTAYILDGILEGSVKPCWLDPRDDASSRAETLRS